MVIKKELKARYFKYDDKQNSLWIGVPLGNEVCLSKAHMFSLMRFLVRISARLSSKRRKRRKVKNEKEEQKGPQFLLHI